MKRPGPIKRGGSLRRRSDKRQAMYETQRIPLVRRILAERPFCEARWPGCTRRSEDVHEIVSRARGGSILDEDNVKALCRHCHDEVTGNPQKAHLLGLSRHSWERGSFPRPLP